MPKSKVFAVRTSPKTVLKDYERLLKISNYRKALPKRKKVILKLNLSWSLFYPACSTPPWQLEGVLNVLKRDGYEIIPVENQTVVTHPWKGAYFNKWLPILKKFGLKFVPLTDTEWVPYKPKGETPAMNELFGGKLIVPKIFIGSNMVHLPTFKTHGHTTTSGAMKNAFGGLIPKYRHHSHKLIHEILVDLLQIQKEIHPGMFAVMDGSIAGNGAGPRTMIPVEANILLASDDQVAIDSIASKIMGFDPMSIDYIRLAHDKGLGMGDPKQIEVIGDDIRRMNFKFRVSRSPVIYFDQLFRKRLAKYLPFIEKLVFHTPVFKIPILCSGFYHDSVWYPIIGRTRIKKFEKTGWGEVWNAYEYGEKPKFKEPKEWDPY